MNVLQEAGVGCLLVGESLVKQDTPDVGIKKLRPAFGLNLKIALYKNRSLL